MVKLLANGYIESIDKVEGYLKDLKSILCSDDFDLNRDIDILYGIKTDSAGYKNAETIAALEYDKSNIRDTLLALTVNEYSETFADIKDSVSPPLYVFGKTIATHEIYIKVKIRSSNARQVFCISFHFAQYHISKPYSTKKEQL